VQALQDKYGQVLKTDSYLANNLAEIERSATEAMQIGQENRHTCVPFAWRKWIFASLVADAFIARKYPRLFNRIEMAWDDLPTVIAGGQSLTFVF